MKEESQLRKKHNISDATFFYGDKDAHDDMTKKTKEMIANNIADAMRDLAIVMETRPCWDSELDPKLGKKKTEKAEMELVFKNRLEFKKTKYEKQSIRSLDFVDKTALNNLKVLIKYFDVNEKKHLNKWGDAWWSQLWIKDDKMKSFIAAIKQANQNNQEQGRFFGRNDIVELKYRTSAGEPPGHTPDALDFSSLLVPQNAVSSVDA